MVRECSWLGAVSTHTNDYGRTSQIRASLDALLTAYPELCIALNHFDAGGEAPDTRSAGQRRQHGRLQVTWVPGMKGLFWKRVLTPERTRGMRMVWLFDADVAVHPSVMPLGLLASALLSSNASALQPLVRAAGMGTDHKWLRQRPSLSSCAASTAKFVEVMTPFLQSDTWEHFHRHVLSHIPDDALARSDFGIDVTWCAAFADAFPLRPPLPRSLWRGRGPHELELHQALHECNHRQGGTHVRGDVPLPPQALQQLLDELHARHARLLVSWPRWPEAIEEAALRG